MQRGNAPLPFLPPKGKGNPSKRLLPEQTNSSYSLNQLSVRNHSGYVSAVAGVGWVNGREIRGVKARAGTINTKPRITLADIAI